jgi:phage terminase small subunit
MKQDKPFDPSKPLKNPKEEIFCRERVRGVAGAVAARKAGYAARTAGVTSSKKLSLVNVQARIAFLLEKAADATIMSVVERKRKLSTLGRGDIGDYLTYDDGATRISVTEETPNKAAVSALEIKDDSSKIKLHDPVKAIQELNKMEGVYPKGEIDVNLNNVTFVMPDNKRQKGKG